MAREVESSGPKDIYLEIGCFPYFFGIVGTGRDASDGCKIEEMKAGRKDGAKETQSSTMARSDLLYMSPRLAAEGTRLRDESFWASEFIGQMMY